MLGIPAWHDLGFDLYNISARWYSAAKVMHAAAAHRGMKKLVSALVRAATRGGTVKRPPFEASVPQGVAAFGGPTDQAFSDDAASNALATAAHWSRPHQAGAESFGGEWFLKNLATGVVSAAGSAAAGAVAGWLFQAVGLNPNPTPAYASQIESQLNQLAAQMSQLQDEINAVNSAVQATYYATESSDLTHARSLLDTAMMDENYVAGDTNDQDRAYWSQIYFENVITPIALDREPWGSTLVLINNVLVAPPPGVKPLGFQSAMYIKSEGPFFTLTKSEQMWQVVDFWTQYAVEALDVYLEYEHQVGGQNHCNNPPTSAGCPLQAQVDYTQKLGDQALATLQSGGRPLQPLPVASSGPNIAHQAYTIDIRSGLMWCTPCEYEPYGGAGVPAGKWVAFTKADAQSSLAKGLYNNGVSTDGKIYAGWPIGFNDFKLPTIDQLAALLNGCGCDPNHPTGVQWLVNNGVLDPTWLHADQNYALAPPVHPGYIDVWVSDVLYPSQNVVVDLKRAQGQLPGQKEYYIPVRSLSPSEGPYYP